MGCLFSPVFNKSLINNQNVFSSSWKIVILSNLVLVGILGHFWGHAYGRVSLHSIQYIASFLDGQVSKQFCFNGLVSLVSEIYCISAVFSF